MKSCFGFCESVSVSVNSFSTDSRSACDQAATVACSKMLARKIFSETLNHANGINTNKGTQKLAPHKIEIDIQRYLPSEKQWHNRSSQLSSAARATSRRNLK